MTKDARDQQDIKQPNDSSVNKAPVDNAVFYTSVAILTLVLGTTALAPESAGDFFSNVQGGIVAYGSWYYVLIVAVILVSVLVISFSRFGEIKLGPNHAEPDYSLISWFAMLFAAGMGIGLMFFGVAEPVNHFLSPPLGEGGTATAAQESMNLTFFHWGLHAWAIYAVVALILAYFGFRHDLPLTLRSALYPLVGERIYGPLGTAVDVFAIVSTTFGVATSLGFGVEQINSGLNVLFDVPKTISVQVGLVVLTTALATVSVMLGLDAGIKRLSEINIALAVALLVGVLAFGPTVYLLQMFMQNTGGYLAEIVSKTFNLYAYEPTDWLGGWTIFYWGWWISWAPFVGLFIARISRGRTLREFAFGVLAAPTLFTLLWMTVFGNSAISLILDQGMTDLALAVQQDESVALFRFLETFPAAELLSGLAIVMVFVFFITSADSGAMVLNMLSSKGRDDTPLLRRAFWMAMIGASALILMVAGGLPALQTAAIAGALPFSLVVVFAIWGLVRALSVDHTKRVALNLNAPYTLSPPQSNWQERLANALEAPSADEVNTFIKTVGEDALQAFAQELKKYGFKAEVTISESPQQVTLTVLQGEEVNFRYAIVSRFYDGPSKDGPSNDIAERGDLGRAEEQGTEQPGHAKHMDDAAGKSRSVRNSDTHHRYFRAEVLLGEGSQDYDLFGLSQEEVINDVVGQYETHLHFLHMLR